VTGLVSITARPLIGAAVLATLDAPSPYDGTSLAKISLLRALDGRGWSETWTGVPVDGDPIVLALEALEPELRERTVLEIRAAAVRSIAELIATIIPASQEPGEDES
jgi:hypothetical protein